jgi:hypothetical protein
MKYNLLIFCLLCLASCTVPQSSGNSPSNPKALQFIDRAYEDQIRTILLYPSGAPRLSPVIQLGKGNLVLQFDDLVTDTDSYYARIEHCNYDWTESLLHDLDYMPVYNEFPINNFEFSVDTHIPYVHYWFELPQVRLPGNYVLVVYRGGNKEDIVLTRRFMVFEQQVVFSGMDNLIGSGNIADASQQINFTVKYPELAVVNPLVDVRVDVRQNQRWDNLAHDIRPSFVSEINKELEYRYFEESKIFKGGNEFRFFDLRSLNYPGRNVATINKTRKPFEATIDVDKSKKGQAYAQYDDINGNFFLDNYDYRNLAYSNYVNVNFALSTPPVDGDVYVAGAYNYWALNDANRMTYDSSAQQYKLRTMLKQGWYDYQYVVKSKTVPSYYFEGSHFETENFYEVFVYYRPYKPQADLLVGYAVLTKNPRPR